MKPGPPAKAPDTSQPHPTTSGSTTMQRLTADSVTLGYDQRVIAENLSVEIPDQSFTVIVGPNACGKSTLLRALSRMLKPSAGRSCSTDSPSTGCPRSRSHGPWDCCPSPP